MRELLRVLRHVSALAAAASLLFGPAAQAAFPLTIVVANAKDIKWAVQGTSVYFRNLDSFDATAPGCCYNVWIDLTTDTGRAMFSAFLTRNASAQRIMFYLDTSVVGKVAIVGDW
jgi:hypothetical protein